jgi:glycine cleavage system H protein
MSGLRNSNQDASKRGSTTLADYDLPKDLRYSKDDEWVRTDSEGGAVVGITDFAQQKLGDVVFVELPEVGASFSAGDSFGVIESVKAVADLYCPIDGKVAEVNESLEDTPETVNEACYGDGWIMKLKPTDPAQIAALMDADGYAANIAGRDD